MIDFLSRPWPWYVTGPLIGLIVPMLLVAGNRQFGMSSSLRHICAAIAPGECDFFRYDWRRIGGWNLAFALGVLIGGWIAAQWLGNDAPIAISPATRTDLAGLGIREFAGLVPTDLFSWASLRTVRGLVSIVVGGLLIGFGTAWAGGCTSGHAIAGLADFQRASLIAVIGFFAGGLITTWLILPQLLGRL